VSKKLVRKTLKTKNDKWRVDSKWSRFHVKCMYYLLINRYKQDIAKNTRYAKINRSHNFSIVIRTTRSWTWRVFSRLSNTIKST
jgi:hypothetical protein